MYLRAAQPVLPLGGGGRRSICVIDKNAKNYVFPLVDLFERRILCVCFARLIGKPVGSLTRLLTVRVRCTAPFFAIYSRDNDRRINISCWIP